MLEYGSHIYVFEGSLWAALLYSDMPNTFRFFPIVFHQLLRGAMSFRNARLPLGDYSQFMSHVPQAKRYTPTGGFVDLGIEEGKNNCILGVKHTVQGSSLYDAVIGFELNLVNLFGRTD